MQQLIKRLELIKTCIALGDDEFIQSQLAKLPSSDDERVKGIIAALTNAEYSHAVALIEDFISSVSGLVKYDDLQVASLRLELKHLENQLLALTEEKQTILQQITEFRKQYSLALGELIQKILDLKYRISQQKTLNKLKKQTLLEEAVKLAQNKISALKKKIKKLANSELNEDQIEELSEIIAELKAEYAKYKEAKTQSDAFEKEFAEDSDYQEYQQAKNDKESFEEEFEEIIEQHKKELSEEEKTRLRKAYRKATRLCHPDTVADEFKEQAHELMIALNVAYENQNLAEVERILHLLESGLGFIASSDAIDDIKVLKAKIAELKAKITALSEEIDQMKQDETYQKLQELDNWDDYFEEIKKELTEQLKSLEVEYQELLQSNEQS